MEYISSDTNIWIDFMVTGKLYLPFRLPLTYLMNQDAVDDELLSPQGLRKQLLELGLIPTELTEKEFYYALKIAFFRVERTSCENKASRQVIQLNSSQPFP